MHDIHRSDSSRVFCLRFRVATFTNTPTPILLQNFINFVSWNVLQFSWNFARFCCAIHRLSQHRRTPATDARLAQIFGLIRRPRIFLPATESLATETPKKVPQTPTHRERFRFFFCGRLRNSNWRHPCRGSFSTERTLSARIYNRHMAPSRAFTPGSKLFMLFTFRTLVFCVPDWGDLFAFQLNSIFRIFFLYLLKVIGSGEILSVGHSMMLIEIAKKKSLIWRNWRFFFDCFQSSQKTQPTDHALFVWLELPQFNYRQSDDCTVFTFSCHFIQIKSQSARIRQTVETRCAFMSTSRPEIKAPGMDFNNEFFFRITFRRCRLKSETRNRNQLTALISRKSNGRLISLVNYRTVLS